LLPRLALGYYLCGILDVANLSDAPFCCQDTYCTNVKIR
jgi:hypothetical protein